MRTVVYDIEVTHLKTDLGTLLVASFGELDRNGNVRNIMTNDIHQAGSEKALLEWARTQYEAGDIIMGFNHLAFDNHWLDGALTRSGLPMLPKRMQLDCYQIAKGKYAVQSSSLESLADFFKLNEKKDKPSKHEWRTANVLDEESIKRLRKRCESDVRLTGKLWEKIKPAHFQSKGR